MRGTKPIRCALPPLLLAAAFFLPHPVHANGNDDDFEEILFGLCVKIFSLPGEGWNPSSVNELNDLCNDVLDNGSTPSSDYNSSSNIGSSGATSKSSNTAAQNQVEVIKDRFDELQQEEEPQRGWGLLLSAQAGNTERADTANESGFDSDLAGIVVGGDYRFSDDLVLGLTFSYTNTQAAFDNNTGKLDTAAATLLGYFTLIPLENTYLDAYFGYGALDYDSKRDISFLGSTATPIVYTGTASGDYQGSQLMLGGSGGYDWYFGNWSLGPYFAVDYMKTEVDAYQESGTTSLELRYGDQTIKSLTASLGLNLSYSIEKRWGLLMPTASLTAVHQAEDDARSIDLQPAFVPLTATTPIVETTIFAQTDAPDRDYFLASLGLVAALNDGTQLFATYEQVGGQDFLDTWSISFGMLIDNW